MPRLRLKNFGPTSDDRVLRGRWSRAPDKLTPLLRLRYQNALADASQDLGPPDQIRQTFLGFQQLLYPAHPAHGNAPTL